VNLDGYTALHDAAQENNVTCTQLLIEAGCDINIQDVDGWTALYVAGKYGHTDIAKIILSSSDVNIDARDKVHMHKC